MPGNAQPAVTVTQPKVAFILSLLSLIAIVYAATERYIRREVEFEELQEKSEKVLILETAYSNAVKRLDQLEGGLGELKTEVKSLRHTVDNEIRHMANSINRLSDALESKVEEVN